MRKAYAIIEMLVMMSFLLVIMLVFTKPLKTLVSDIPRINRDFQTNSKMLVMLKQLQSDVESSKSLLEYSTDKRIGHNLLLMETDNGTICYELGNREVTKTVFASRALFYFRGNCYFRVYKIEFLNKRFTPH